MTTAAAHELAVMAEQVTARGVRGVVAAAAPQAAQAGAAALRDGGNAYDAAVAAALAETVLLPPKCGFGGDLIAIVIPGFGAEPEALIAVGGAAAGHAEVARAGRWRDVGPDSVGPPAAAAGYAALADRGRLTRERLASPAIALAVDGFAWAEVCARLSRLAAEWVAEMNPLGCVYYPSEIRSRRARSCDYRASPMCCASGLRVARRCSKARSATRSRVRWRRAAGR